MTKQERVGRSDSGSECGSVTIGEFGRSCLGIHYGKTLSVAENQTKSETFAIDSSVDLSTTSHHHPRQMASAYHAPPTPLSHGPDQPPVSLPKVGQTRCCESLSIPGRSHPSIILLTTKRPPDWAMLSADLQFIYLDPVLASHLEDQAELLVGKSLLSFVHPDEQASANQDLGGVLQSRTLHGSVTRYFFLLSFSLPPYLSHFRKIAVSVFPVCPRFGEPSAMTVLLSSGPRPTKSPLTRTTWLLILS